eukprot:scaffold39194_cov106-Phaeocystis_antarctica.AAC.2
MLARDTTIAACQRYIPTRATMIAVGKSAALGKLEGPRAPCRVIEHAGAAMGTLRRCNVAAVM